MSRQSADAFFPKESVQGAGPGNAYIGMATAVMTFNGIPVIVLAKTLDDLRKAASEINPRLQFNPQLAMPAAILHESLIKREDDEL